MKTIKKNNWRWEPNTQTKIATTFVALCMLATQFILPAFQREAKPNQSENVNSSYVITDTNQIAKSYVDVVKL